MSYYIINEQTKTVISAPVSFETAIYWRDKINTFVHYIKYKVVEKYGYCKFGSKIDGT